MRNLFRLFVPLIINPYYYIKKIKRRSIKNFFEYENKPYNRLSLISLAISKVILKKGYDDCSYLEIGCFDNKAFDTVPLPLSQKIGVDPLRGGTHRMTSDEFFSKNKKFFDVIFIDGSHFFDNVFRDCKNSWPILKKNGILILDDYFWTGYKNLQQNPAFAINKFLKQINHEYKIIKLTKFQLYLKKIN